MAGIRPVAIYWIQKKFGGHQKEFIVMVDNCKPIWWLLYINVFGGHQNGTYLVATRSRGMNWTTNPYMYGC